MTRQLSVRPHRGADIIGASRSLYLHHTGGCSSPATHSGHFHIQGPGHVLPPQRPRVVRCRHWAFVLYTVVGPDEKAGALVQSILFYPSAVCLLACVVCSVNLTCLGGVWCTESGALKRRWSWLDLSTHVHAPPFQPITMTLSPSVSIRICTQDNIYLTFTAGKNSVRFNMGRLKVSQ